VPARILPGRSDAMLTSVVDATLEGAATGPHLHVRATARLDLRAVGIRVPGFLVRRLVDVSVSTRLTWHA